MREGKCLWQILLLLVLFGTVGCGSSPVAQPFSARVPKVKEDKAKEDKDKVKVSEEAKDEMKEEAPKKKFLAGKVTFSGMSAEELADFRVIPETGTTLFTPNNERYEQVDGFWWKGSPEEWFKIPDSSEVWVGKGEVPPRFKGIAHRDGLKVHFRGSGLVKVVGFLRQGAKEPGWVTNGGKTQSPVASPWLEKVKK